MLTEPGSWAGCGGSPPEGSLSDRRKPLENLCVGRAEALAVDERRDRSGATHLAPQSAKDTVTAIVLCGAVFVLAESLDIAVQRPHSGSGSFHQPAADEFVHQRAEAASSAAQRPHMVQPSGVVLVVRWPCALSPNPAICDQ